MKMRLCITALFVFLLTSTQVFAQTQEIKNIINDNYSDIENLYKHLHANPELSRLEDQTSDKMASELRDLNYNVTENVGGHGVVAVLKNGEGPTVLVRSDLDALPINEQTGVPFASDVTMENREGDVVPVMHACGHDMHMSIMVGVAKIMVQMKDQWQGTLVLIGQPAEELLSGAASMIEDGLFEKFPRPDYALALHVNSAMASGKVGYTPGYAYATVIDEASIIVKGRGGHGAYPDLTIDPVVLASKLVMDLQTIVSREISALDPALISVGAIHGGTSGNIVPNEVKLDLTIRAFDRETREKLIKKIRQRCEGIGRSVGLPEEKWPTLKIDEDPLPSMYNDPELSDRVGQVFEDLLGPENVSEIQPLLYGEDFAEYGRVPPRIPILMYSLGSQKPADIKADREGKIEMPSTHNSRYIPDREPTLRTGMLTMSSAIMDLLSE